MPAICRSIGLAKLQTNVMIKTLVKTIVRWLRSEEGPTSVEYAVMLMLVLAAAITTIQLFGDATGDSLQDSSEKIGNAIGGG